MSSIATQGEVPYPARNVYPAVQFGFGRSIAYRPQRPRASVNMEDMNFHIFNIFDVIQNASDSRSLYRKRAFDRAIGNV